MAVTSREEKVWASAWVGLGVPAMAAGFIQGYRHHDDGTMFGTAAVVVVILAINLPILRGVR